MLRQARRTTRRIHQTIRTFDNGLVVLGGLTGRRLFGCPSELVFRLPDGGSVTCPNVPGARVPVYEVFAEDAYRLAWFTGDLGPEASALDIGGHVGCFSLAFARLHPLGRVHAYEASPTTARYLARNIAANDLDDRVVPHPVAVAAGGGTLQLADNAGGSALNGRTAPDHVATVTVQATSFTDAVAAMGGSVDVVKIDTEGAEYDIVLGSSGEDWVGVRRVVLEYHDVPGQDRSQLEGFLTGGGLRVVRHEPATDRHGTLWLRRD